MTVEPSPETPFDLEVVFDADDYLFVYRDDLTDERSDAETAHWVKLLEMNPPMQVLDLACGFGRHSNRLAQQGLSVTAIDLMPGFLSIARQHAAEMGVQVDYRQGDMRRLSFDEAFDRVLLLFTSFGYFEDRDNLQVLQRIARALKPGGLLGFDIPNRDVAVEGLPATDVIEKGRDLVINQLSYDMLSGRLHNRRIVIRNGSQKDKPFSIRLYNASEIKALLTQAGLEPLNILDYCGEPLSGHSRGLVVIARKPLQV
jgi:SAM-dependent methyltransferase